ncbi:MAG: hypothetical protein QW753_06870 [Thermofilum sp.]
MYVKLVHLQVEGEELVNLPEAEPVLRKIADGSLHECILDIWGSCSSAGLERNLLVKLDGRMYIVREYEPFKLGLKSVRAIFLLK